MAERLRLGELLVKSGAIDEMQLLSALGLQRQYGQPLGKTLVGMSFVDEQTVVRTLARQLKVPVVWLDGNWVEEAVLALVPPGLALKHCCLPLAVMYNDTGKVLHLAMEDPGNIEALDEVRFHVGHPVSPVLAGPIELEEAVERHYGAAGGAHSAPNRQGVHNVPEMLTIKPIASPAPTGLEPDSSSTDSALVSARAELHEIARRLDALMHTEVLDRDEVGDALKNALSGLHEEPVLLLEDESDSF
jgi:hypothetical protein